MINRYGPGLLIFAVMVYLIMGPFTSCRNRRNFSNHLKNLESWVLKGDPESIDARVKELYIKREKLSPGGEPDQEILNSFTQIAAKLKSMEEEKRGNQDLDGAILALERAIALTSGNCPQILKREQPELHRRLRNSRFQKWYNLGQKQYAEKDFTAALDSLNNAQKYHTTPELQKMLSHSRYIVNYDSGIIAAENKKYAVALQHLAIAHDEKPSPTLKARIRQLEKKKRLQELRPLVKSLVKNKKNIEALEALMEICQLEGRRKNPFDLLKDASYTNESGYPEIQLAQIRFVYIEGGIFPMGCFHAGDRLRLDDALPVHEVRLQSFWISVTEVTLGQYKGSGGLYPVRHVTWNEAADFARKLSMKFRLKVNLPTEAQWEYAAREGGKEIPYPWGYGIDCKKAKYMGCGKSGVQRVGSYPANKWGIKDLAGNVREWCRDGYTRSYYKHSARVNPCNHGGDKMRVVRGGSYADGPDWALKTYFRYYRPRDAREQYTGIRLVIER